MKMEKFVLAAALILALYGLGAIHILQNVLVCPLARAFGGHC